MKTVTLAKLLSALSAAVLAVLLQHNPHFQNGTTLVYDPAGVTVSSTTIPIEVASTTIKLILSTASSGIQIGLVAADLQTQQFINNFGSIFLHLGGAASSDVEEVAGGDWFNPWTIPLNSITASGTYPFLIYLTFQNQTTEVTGTIIAQ